MNREKQIAKMLKCICMDCRYFTRCNDDTMCNDGKLSQVLKERCSTWKIGEEIYDAGYRKQSEVIDEFAKRLIDAFPEANPNHRSPCLYYDEYRYIIEELAEELKGGE